GADVARLDVGLNDRRASADVGVVEQGRREAEPSSKREDKVRFQREFLGRSGTSRTQLSEKQGMIVRHDVAVPVRRHDRQIEAFGELDQLARRSTPLHAASRKNERPLGLLAQVYLTRDLFFL